MSLFRNCQKIRKILDGKMFESKILKIFLIRKVKTDYSNRLKSGLDSDSGMGLEMNPINKKINHKNFQKRPVIKNCPNSSHF